MIWTDFQMIILTVPFWLIANSVTLPIAWCHVRVLNTNISWQKTAFRSEEMTGRDAFSWYYLWFICANRVTRAHGSVSRVLACWLRSPHYMCLGCVWTVRITLYSLGVVPSLWVNGWAKRINQKLCVHFYLPTYVHKSFEAILWLVNIHPRIKA